MPTVSGVTDFRSHPAIAVDDQPSLLDSYEPDAQDDDDFWSSTCSSPSAPLLPSPPGASPSSFTELETSLEFELASGFSDARAARDSLVARLRMLADYNADRLAEQLEACASQFYVYSIDGNLRLFPSLCRQRACPICQQVRSRKLRQRFLKEFALFKQPRFLTLTIRKQRGDFKTNLGHIRRSFTRLRARKEWKRHVTKGLWCLQYTIDQDSGAYHVHLHMIIDGRYFPHSNIKCLWAKVTGDSTHVDIRKATKRHVKYLAKDIFKNGLEVPGPSKLLEHLDTLKHVRLFGTFGVKPTPKQLQLVKPDIRKLQSLDYYIRHAQRGWQYAVNILDALALNYLPAETYHSSIAHQHTSNN